MYLNADRWKNGASPSKLVLKDYRQYMVTHEMGHILGHDHVKCPGKGKPAPIMMQQTLGIGDCAPNTKLTDSDRKKSR
jgi:ssRNA-specific RNase YbeY (16S rRNA maturation enzyme)